MKITYTFADGTSSVVEVDNDTADVIVELDKQERNSYQKLHRRSVSLESCFDDNNGLATNEDIVSELIQKEKYDTLYRAIKQLRPEHRDLIVALYFKEKKMTELAKETNRSVSSISHQRNTALQKLGKILMYELR